MPADPATTRAVARAVFDAFEAHDLVLLHREDVRWLSEDRRFAVRRLGDVASPSSAMRCIA
jgi:hypothetical protein